MVKKSFRMYPGFWLYLHHSLFPYFSPHPINIPYIECFITYWMNGIPCFLYVLWLCEIFRISFSICLPVSSSKEIRDMLVLAAQPGRKRILRSSGRSLGVKENTNAHSWGSTKHARWDLKTSEGTTFISLITFMCLLHIQEEFVPLMFCSFHSFLAQFHLPLFLSTTNMGWLLNLYFSLDFLSFPVTLFIWIAYKYLNSTHPSFH
jgi:hypothetical protein